jgi:hypothetical protein
MQLNLSDFSVRANSHFTGRSFANGLKVESVWRKHSTSASSQNDYIAVLVDGRNQRAVVPYGKLISALRTVNADASVMSLFNTYKIVVTAPAIPAAAVAPVTAAAPAAPSPTVGLVATQYIDADKALDLMTVLVKAARTDAKVANVVKSLAALV